MTASDRILAAAWIAVGMAAGMAAAKATYHSLQMVVYAPDVRVELGLEHPSGGMWRREVVASSEGLGRSQTLGHLLRLPGDPRWFGDRALSARMGAPPGRLQAADPEHLLGEVSAATVEHSEGLDGHVFRILASLVVGVLAAAVALGLSALAFEHVMLRIERLLHRRSRC